MQQRVAEAGHSLFQLYRFICLASAASHFWWSLAFLYRSYDLRILKTRQQAGRDNETGERRNKFTGISYGFTHAPFCCALAAASPPHESIAWRAGSPSRWILENTEARNCCRQDGGPQSPCSSRRRREQGKGWPERRTASRSGRFGLLETSWQVGHDKWPIPLITRLTIYQWIRQRKRTRFTRETAEGWAQPLFRRQGGCTGTDGEATDASTTGVQPEGKIHTAGQCFATTGGPGGHETAYRGANSQSRY